jgi:hypothetical protein
MKEVPQSEQPAAAPLPAEPSRRGRYLGVSGRRFESYPFGSTLVCQSGEIYELGLEYEYLWTDTNFAHLWEWDPK